MANFNFDSLKLLYLFQLEYLLLYEVEKGLILSGCKLNIIINYPRKK